MMWIKIHNLNTTVDTYQIVPDELGSGLWGDITPKTVMEVHTESSLLAW